MRAKRVLLKIAFTLLVIAVSGLLYLRWNIQSGVNKWCETAQASHPHQGDNVGAMLEYLQNDSHSLQDRNHVVWAIGQCRDSRALPTLESYYTGKECDHDSSLCQKELHKAIELCKGSTPNILAINQPQ